MSIVQSGLKLSQQIRSLNRARHLAKKNKMPEAVETYTKLINDDASLDIAYLRRGNCYEIMGNIPEAIQDYYQYVALGGIFQPHVEAVLTSLVNSKDKDKPVKSYVNDIAHKRTKSLSAIEFDTIILLISTILTLFWFLPTLATSSFPLPLSLGFVFAVYAIVKIRIQIPQIENLLYLFVFFSGLAIWGYSQAPTKVEFYSPFALMSALNIVSISVTTWLHIKRRTVPRILRHINNDISSFWIYIGLPALTIYFVADNTDSGSMTKMLGGGVGALGLLVAVVFIIASFRNKLDVFYDNSVQRAEDIMKQTLHIIICGVCGGTGLMTNEEIKATAAVWQDSLGEVREDVHVKTKTISSTCTGCNGRGVY